MGNSETRRDVENLEQKLISFNIDPDYGPIRRAINEGYIKFKGIKNGKRGEHILILEHNGEKVEAKKTRRNRRAKVRKIRREIRIPTDNVGKDKSSYINRRR